MQISDVVNIYFSPTCTTQKVITAIAKGITTELTKNIDLTLPDSILRDISDFNNELVLIGSPVYGGRLPAEAVKRLTKLKGMNTPAILVVLYGNRDFEDALIELKDLALKNGFMPVAGAAFIGEHSYSKPETPIAVNRPNADDLARAEQFGKEIMTKLSSIDDICKEPPITVPGKTPYKDSMPVMNDCAMSALNLCNHCSTCVTLCPTGAISDDDSYTTDPQLCIMCCACIKGCPAHARYMNSERIKKLSKQLSENCSITKQPAIFI